MTTFHIETFARDCKLAMAAATDRQAAAAELLRATIARHGPNEIVATLNASIPPDADIGEMIVHQSAELTMLFGRLPARFQTGIHDHTVFACIGQLTGSEINTEFEPTEDGKLRVVATRTVDAGEVITLRPDAIHRIENPTTTPACSLHLYGGDFRAVAERRSLWSHDDHARIAFSFPSLLRESLQTMRASGNQAGLDAAFTAIPAARKLIE